MLDPKILYPRVVFLSSCCEGLFFQFDSSNNTYPGFSVDFLSDGPELLIGG